MSKIEKFEDLIAWQKSRILAKVIYEITRKPGFAKDFALTGQIQRAAVSIMSNVADELARIIGGLRAAVEKRKK